MLHAIVRRLCATTGVDGIKVNENTRSQVAERLNILFIIRRILAGPGSLERVQSFASYQGDL